MEDTTGQFCVLNEYNQPAEYSRPVWTCIIKGHIASIHENRKPFTCEICSISFARKPNLKKHIESVHAGKKPFKCDISDANFTQKPNLKQHIESDNEGNKPNILNQFMKK